jgi:hypothetical protein
MKGLLTVGVLAGLLAFAAPQRAEAGVHVSVGIGVPVFGAVVTAYPAYPYYPAYHYGPPAVYVHAPVPYPRRGYGKHGYHRAHYGHGRGHRHQRHYKH